MNSNDARFGLTTGSFRSEDETQAQAYRGGFVVLRRLVTLVASLALVVGGLLGISSSTPANASSWVTVDAPYVHVGTFNRWVETNAYTNQCCSPTTVESTLYQYYGGAWHQVSDSTVQSSTGQNKAKSYVYCGSPYTSYSFQARGRVWVQGPSGWYLQGQTWSAVVTRSC